MKADGRQIPYIVAGNGGYFNLSKLKMNATGTKPTPGKQAEPDGQGNTIALQQFNDSNFGFLRITVDAASILVESLGVANPAITTSPTAPVLPAAGVPPPPQPPPAPPPPPPAAQAPTAQTQATAPSPAPTAPAAGLGFTYKPPADWELMDDPSIQADVQQKAQQGATNEE